MRYVYKNVTSNNQSVLLASKNQDTVGTRLFTPGSTLELDYPGLNLYVPNLLSCTIIGDTNSIVSSTIIPVPLPVSAQVTESIVTVEPVDLSPIIIKLPVISEPISEPISKLVVEILEADSIIKESLVSESKIPVKTSPIPKKKFTKKPKR